MLRQCHVSVPREGCARTFRIGDGGDNATDAEGLGFGSDNKGIVREVGVGAVEHGAIGHLFDYHAVLGRCAI